MSKKKPETKEMIEKMLEVVKTYQKTLEYYAEHPPSSIELYRTTVYCVVKFVKEYPRAIDNLTSSLPLPYRIAVKGFFQLVKDERWDRFLEKTANFLKEFGKDENGEYKKVEDVLEELPLKLLDYLPF